MGRTFPVKMALFSQFHVAGSCCGTIFLNCGNAGCGILWEYISSPKYCLEDLTFLLHRKHLLFR